MTMAETEKVEIPAWVGELQNAIKANTDAIAELQKAATPAQRTAAREARDDSQDDIEKLLKRHGFDGLTRDDLEKLREERSYAQFAAMAKRYQEELDAEAEAANGAGDEVAARRKAKAPAKKEPVAAETGEGEGDEKPTAAGAGKGGWFRQ